MKQRFTISVYVGVFFLILIPLSTFSQQAVDTNNRKFHLYRPDTSEQALLKSFRDLMNNSETVIDAQVISMESKWGRFHYEAFPNGIRGMYTTVTFKVFHWIKGSIASDEVTFYYMGGKIGDTVEMVTHSPIFSLKQRAIFFFQNKEPNTYLVSKGRIPIFGSEIGAPPERHGVISVGTYNVDAENYIDVVKQSVTDTTAYPKYIHRLKMAEEEYRLRSLKWKNGVMPPEVADSVHRAVRQKMKERFDSTKGGVR